MSVAWTPTAGDRVVRADDPDGTVGEVTHVFAAAPGKVAVAWEDGALMNEMASDLTLAEAETDRMAEDG